MPKGYTVKLTLSRPIVVELDADDEGLRDALEKNGANMEDITEDDVHDAVREMLSEDLTELVDLNDLSENDFTIRVEERE